MWHSLIPGLLILPLLLTACAPLGVNVNVIKIGLVAPFEGRYRYIGYDAIYAARMAVREINTQGGIDGWRIDLVAYDGRASPQMAQDAARNLTVDRDIIAVIGHYRGKSTAAAQPIYAAANMPLIVIGTWLSASLSTSPPRHLWHLMPPPDPMAQAMVDAANISKDQGTMAVMGVGPLASALDQRAHAMLATDYAGWIADNFQRPSPPADTVLSILPPHIGAENLARWRALNWQGHYIDGFDCAAGEFTAIAGEAMEGVQFITPYPLPQALIAGNGQTAEYAQAIARWTTRYQAIGPHVAPPSVYALPTYEAVYLLSEALALAPKPPSRAGIAAALPNIQRQGLLGHIAWDTNGFWSQARLYIYQWTAGEPILTSQVPK
jgi:ABC-type branched-subunit amino acid transport system substrate-binding protein